MQDPRPARLAEVAFLHASRRRRGVLVDPNLAPGSLLFGRVVQRKSLVIRFSEIERREYRGDAKRRGALAPALETVAYVDFQWLGKGGCETDQSALAASFHFLVHTVQRLLVDVMWWLTEAQIAVALPGGT